MTVTLTIDGREVTVPAGSTILDAARALDIDIPTMCFVEDLEPACSCFICVVQVQGRAGLVPSCGQPAEEGMVVTTDSETVRDARRMALDLLLSEHRGDCIAPCSLACPAGLDIPGFIALLEEGRSRESIGLIKERIPLPAALGRICARYCERVCRRSESEEPIAICALKRYAADTDLASGDAWVPEVAAASGKTVAVVGAGPSGLSAAFYLRRAGHAVKVIDEREEPGGMLRYGVPAFRLPRGVLAGEIDVIRRMGAEFRMRTRIGRDVSLDELAGQFDAVVVAAGSTAEDRPTFDGADECVSGLAFLREHATVPPAELGECVAVIGNGYEAVACARVAARSGARVVLLSDVEKRRMTAFGELVDAAIEEGIELVEAVQALSVGAGRVRYRVADEECDLVAGTVIAAPVRSVDAAAMKALGLHLSGRGVRADRDTLATGMPKVFAAGDVVTGPGTGVRAVAAGRSVAGCVDQFLRGEVIAREGRPFNVPLRTLTDEDREALLRHVERSGRVAVPVRPVAERVADFDEIDCGLEHASALSECARCLQCDCLARDVCKLRAYAAQYGAGPNRFSATPHPFVRDASSHEVVFEPHKCILCGVCVRLAEARGEKLGIGFQQRGYTTRVAVPFEAQLAEGLAETYRLCAEACPTGALAVRRNHGERSP